MSHIRFRTAVQRAAAFTVRFQCSEHVKFVVLRVGCNNLITIVTGGGFSSAELTTAPSATEE